MCDYRLLVLAIVSVSLLPMAGCVGAENGYEDYEYTVSVSEPHTGDVFSNVTETQFYSWGGGYALVTVSNSVNESLVDSSGNWSIPDGNATTVQLEHVRVTNNGSTEVLLGREITPDDPDWGAHLDFPSDGDEDRYLLRATANNRTIDYVEITIRET